MFLHRRVAIGVVAIFLVTVWSLPLLAPGWFAVLVAIGERVGGTVTGSSRLLVTLALWQLLILYAIPVGFWSYEVALYHWKKYQAKRHPNEAVHVEWTPDAVQVRILTVANQDVVQQTVDALPETLTDVVVIAEEAIDIEGAEVIVVPQEFSCQATHKGRAVEYARRNHPTDKEYVLYLDEDTRVPAFTGIPSNADIVQFRERPVRTGGLIPYLAEIHRIGFNIEQRVFPYIRVPFYAWGGGIAVRRTLEDKVTWDTQTLVEDSVFTWRSVLEEKATFEVVDVFFENQAPPSIRSMINQRRRWLTGTRSKAEMLPFNYRVLYHLRDIGWALSVFGPVFWILSALTYFGLLGFSLSVTILPSVYTALSLLLLAHVYLWSILGLWYYRERGTVWFVLLLFTPFIVTIHSAGALYGIVSPAKQFAVTEKISNTVEKVIDIVEDAPVVPISVPETVVPFVPGVGAVILDRDVDADVTVPLRGFEAEMGETLASTPPRRRSAGRVDPEPDLADPFIWGRVVDRDPFVWGRVNDDCDERHPD